MQAPSELGDLIIEQSHVALTYDTIDD
jgi:hypothetical protein